MDGKPIKMCGNILTMTERVDDEFTKLLQTTDAHSTDYVTKYVTVVYGMSLNLTLCSLILVLSVVSDKPAIAHTIRTGNQTVSYNRCTCEGE